MNDVAARLADNLAQVRGRIEAAAARSARPADSVMLVAVTKHIPAPIVASLIEAGATELGESRPQELWSKAARLERLPVHWHLIGHLQRNKIARTLPFLSLIHSVDSWRLLSTIDQAALELERSMGVLLEVNVSKDVTKTGLSPAEIESLLEKAAPLRHVSIRGLMAMASFSGGETSARRDFARLRELRDRLRKNCPPSVSLDQLSMGMSGDYEVAIEEGATIVRVGSALFEGIDP